MKKLWLVIALLLTACGGATSQQATREALNATRAAATAIAAQKTEEARFKTPTPLPTSAGSLNPFGQSFSLGTPTPTIVASPTPISGEPNGVVTTVGKAWIDFNDRPGVASATGARRLGVIAKGQQLPLYETLSAGEYLEVKIQAWAESAELQYGCSGSYDVVVGTWNQWEHDSPMLHAHLFFVPISQRGNVIGFVEPKVVVVVTDMNLDTGMCQVILPLVWIERRYVSR